MKAELYFLRFIFILCLFLCSSWGSYDGLDVRDVKIELLDEYGLIRVHYGDVLDF